jgi:hypothetical protein
LILKGFFILNLIFKLNHYYNRFKFKNIL